MKKKILVGTISLTIVGLCGGLIALNSLNSEATYVEGNAQYHILLDSDCEVETKDEGYLHQVNVKNNKIDMIGWSSTGGDFGSIKKDTYGSFEYNGMIYNRSLINGFSSLTVTFSNGNLSYVFSDFLMENMDFDGSPLVSGTPVNVPDNKAYFIIYNESTTPVNIDSIDITYTCDASVDASLIFNKNTPLGGARSLAKKTILDDNFVTIENNPTKSTNNYSTGSHGGHNSSWYRFNGRYFTESEALGTEFSFGLTIAGNISQVVDETKYFHYNVWPQLGWYDQDNVLHSDANNYVQTYIGNDNYEPLGKDHALRPSDPYAQSSYPGRFFTNYDWYDEQWKFADPDVETIADGVTTFREAYEAYSLPFWFIRFDVYLKDNNPACDVSINGFKLFTQEDIFDDYDKVNTPDLVIHTFPMHVVNYGIDDEGNPADSYTGCFTYPRIIA